MSKFKVGDRVVVVREETAFSFERGKIRRFIEDNGYSVQVLLDNKDTVCFHPAELEFEEVYDSMSAKPNELVIEVNVPEGFKFDPSKVMDLEEPEVEKGPTDEVSHPSHYTSHPSGVECIEITKHMGFLDGNAMKYLWRYSLKNGVEDLYKCRQYLDWLIEAEEAKRG